MPRAARACYSPTFDTSVPAESGSARRLGAYATGACATTRSMNGFRIQHLGLAVPDLPAALRVHEDLFGWTLLSGPFDDPTQQARVAFVGPEATRGVELQLIAPLDEKSHVARLLEKGMSAYHICCEVVDIEAAVRELRTRGCLIVREPVAAVAFQGRRIAWFYTPTRQLMELVERGR